MQLYSYFIGLKDIGIFHKNLHTLVLFKWFFGLYYNIIWETYNLFFLTNVALPHGFLGTNSKINADLVCVGYLPTGMPFNQLGTLAGSKFYNVEATYYYLRWWAMFIYVCSVFNFSRIVVSLNRCNLCSAFNQMPPLRAPTATWSACLTKLPRCIIK